MQSYTDKELIERYKKGDERSLELLIARYMDQIYGFVYSLISIQQSAEDITQEVFLKVWKNAKNIDQSKNFKSWLFTIAKNTTLDAVKKKKAIPFSLFENSEGKNVLIDMLGDETQAADMLARSRETNSIFLAAIKQLSRRYQVVLDLYYYQYLNFREIAEKLKEPLSTIKSRHRRGLSMLKELVAERLL